MHRWILLSALALCGCGASNSVTNTLLSPPPLNAPAGNLSGVLARSSSGAIQLLDAPLPAGFQPEAGAQVRLLQTGVASTSGANGQVSLSAPEGVQRLWVHCSDGTEVVLSVPVFSANRAAGVQLAFFPDRFQLRQQDVLAARVVQVDAQGRFSPAASVAWSQSDAPAPLVPPTTSEEAALYPALTGTNPPSAASDERVVGGDVGQFELSARSGGLTQSADYLAQPPACLASLAGRVTVAGQPVPGALVQVEGFPVSARTDADGNYQLGGLAAVPSQVHVYQDELEIGLGFAPLTSRMLTRLDIPARSVKYAEGPLLALPQVTGLATRPNDTVEVCDGSTLRLFGSNGQEQPAPPQVTLNHPRGLASDFSGQVYVADQGGNEVTRAAVPLVKLPVPEPAALALDGGANLYVLGQGLSFLANTGGNSWGAPRLLSADLLNPSGLAVSRDGRLFVADTGHDRVAVLELTQGQPGRMLRGDPANGPVQARLVDQWSVSDPAGIALGPEGAVYVATPQGVQAWTPDGHDPIPVSSKAAEGPLAVDRQGRVWVKEDQGVRQYLPSISPVAPQLTAQPSGRSLLTDSAFLALENQFQTAMRDFEIPGGTLAISINGRLVVERGYGYSRLDLDQQILTQPGQLFRLASCSKAFTAVTTLLQMQDYPGRLSLTTRPLQAGGLLDNLLASGVKDNRLERVEAAHLLRMTAAMDDPTALYAPLARTLGGQNPPATSVQTLLHIFSTTNLSGLPGSAYVYSDVAYVTLGRLVEAVARAEGLSATTYGAYCQQRLLAAVGIQNMRIADTRFGQTAPNEVSYYPFAGEPCSQSVFTNQPEIVPAPYGAVFDGLSHDSAGGWIASCTDLIRFANAVAPDKTPPGFNNPLDATRRLWMKELPQAANDTAARYFGAGWNFMANDQGVITSMSKDGALPGTMSWVEYLRQGEDQVVYVFLFNSRPGPGSKKSSDALVQVRTALRNFIAQQAGHWPAGNLWP